jgi:hypothetical protein
MMVTIDNYEYFFYQYAEGLLTEAERADVEAFARQHPDLAEELSLYDPAVKAEAPAEVFPDKESLLRHEPVRIPMWRWAAAACVAGLLLVGVWQFAGRSSQQPIVAELTPTVKPVNVDTNSFRNALPDEVMTTETLAAIPAQVASIQHKAVAEPLPPMVQHEAVLDEPLLAEAMPTEMQRNDAVETTVIIYTDYLLMPEETIAMVEVDTAYTPSYLDDLLRQGRSLYDRLRARALRAEGDTRVMLASL